MGRRERERERVADKQWNIEHLYKIVSGWMDACGVVVIVAVRRCRA